MRIRINAARMSAAGDGSTEPLLAFGIAMRTLLAFVLTFGGSYLTAAVIREIPNRLSGIFSRAENKD